MAPLSQVLISLIQIDNPGESGYIDLQMIWEATGRPPSFMFGGGNGDTTHKADEHIKIEDLIKTRDFFVEVLKVHDLRYNTFMRKLQIGVMGSAADLKYSKEVELIAERLGELIAEASAVLVFGAEKDSDSLSTAACRGAKKHGGMTVGVTYGKGKAIWDKKGQYADFIVASGLERGGGRETTLVLSCDAVIAVSGGSGTLTELAIAYQADIPMVAMNNTGGWAAKLADSFIDGRERRKTFGASTPEEAVETALREAKEYVEKYG